MQLSLTQRRTIRHQFDALCKKVLRDKCREINRRLMIQTEREISICALSLEQLEAISAIDEYPSDNICFDVLDYQIMVQNDELAKALSNLPEKKRDIVLLAYFLDMNDREIAEQLNMVRSTVQRKRANTLKELKTKMEGEENE